MGGYWFIFIPYLIIQFVVLEVVKSKIKKKERKFIKKFILIDTVGGLLGGIVLSIAAQATFLQSLLVIIISMLFMYLSTTSMYRMRKSFGVQDEVD
ncbi:hypothetical protein [Bacillus cihuensis]|uniref:hypothetical protein n=1 Tax=Bacillus cihuensis TaxID=1208599 RepID=UPI00040DF9B1|nr:hypothetical protein [Bacillus cihuensis]